MRWSSIAVCLKVCAMPRGAGATHAGTLLIDDRRSGSAASALGPSWRFFTDAVMGGISSGGMTAEMVQGRAALCLRGQVHLDFNGGFIQMALELPDLRQSPPWHGVELEVCGNGHRYGVHLRTRDMNAPWQAWRARFEVMPQWHTVRLPFEAFEPYRSSGKLQADAVTRIGLLAIGERFDAELCLARLALYR
jgi:hypothetical protein